MSVWYAITHLSPWYWAMCGPIKYIAGFYFDKCGGVYL